MSDDASKTGSKGSGQGATAFTPSSPKPAKTPKNKTFDLRCLADAFLGKPCFWLDTEPDVRFCTVADPYGARKIARHDLERNVISYVSDDFITSVVSKFLVEHGIRCKSSLKDFSPKDLRTIREFILVGGEAIGEDEIVPVAPLSDPRLTYHRLPFDLDSEGLCPTFDEIFSRMTNAKAIQAWIGSLFDFDSSREQYPVLFGDGENSKGRLIEYLMWQFGDAATIGPTVSGGAARYFNATVYNKRLVCYGECDRHSFVTSEEMKAITGNDYVSCDEKNVKLFKGKAICKFFFATNTVPNLKNTRAHRRRIIYAEIAPIASAPISPTQYNKMLQNESQAFLSACWRLYQELTGGGVKPIPTDDASYQRAVEENESEFQEIVDREMEVGDVFHIHSKEIGKLLAEFGLPSNAKKPFIQFLQQKYGVKYGNKRDEHRQTKAYWGVGRIDRGGYPMG